jgi:hypothetical protein
VGRSAAGSALLSRVSIFPWQLGQQTSVMFGLIFLGAPCLERFRTARGGSLISLIIYIAFLLYSGTLAACYLFASNQTRSASDEWPGAAAGAAAGAPSAPTPGAGHSPM